MKPEDNNQQAPQPVTLYDQHGNPVHVHPQHIQPTATSQDNSGNSHVNSQQYNQAAPEAFSKQVHRSSHVTATADSHEGHNFDPRTRAQYANEPKIVHATRPLEPQSFTVSDEIQKLHEQSVKDYPDVNLSQGEYVLHDVHRHPIGLFTPLAVSGVMILSILAILFSYPLLFPVSGLIGFGWLTAIAIALVLLIAVFGYISVWVYQHNRLIITNESVIQEIQHSLFSKHEQTVSLGSVEDASFKQNGIIEMAFNYGSVRLSTEGEESTYRFIYVENPKKQIAIMTNAVEAFKNGRPVTRELLDK